jgi:hypothetical protein
METCCICLDNKWCYWKCACCQEGRICRDCDNSWFDYSNFGKCAIRFNEPSLCPICKQKNVKEHFLFLFKVNNLEGSCETFSYEELDRYPVFHIIERNNPNSIGYDEDDEKDEIRKYLVHKMVYEIFDKFK